jgi:hypothetical protein
MAQSKIAYEIKNRRLTRPMLDSIVGALIRTNPDADELIVLCRGASREALKAVNDYSIRVTIVGRLEAESL